MAEVRATGRRVLVPDARGIDRFVRATWHADEQLFVISTWDGDICTGAVRVEPGELGDLVALLAQGMGSAAKPSRAAG
jgi:hypothetical protein